MDNQTAIAKINDRLRKAMSLGQINIELSESVEKSLIRPQIIKAVREYKNFDPEIDVDGDHSVGVVIVLGDAFVFRFQYGDKRYDYSREIGKRTLSVLHLSEFRSIKFGQKVQSSARRMLEVG